MKEQVSGAPIFVKVDAYKEILDVLDLVKDKVEDIRGTLESLNELRKEEDVEVSKWNKTIDDVESKIAEIDKMMFEME